MKTPSTILAGAVIALGLFGGCARNAAVSTDMFNAIKSTGTKAEHLALADRYEQAAKDADAKAADEKKMQGQWEEHRDLDPKHAEDTQEHYDALIFHYQEIARTNRSLAALQRKIAASM